ncbi:hypothetical protein [Paractinoplanes rishiriensis]|uniref:Lipoprotein n=1 Tax=Paractinoplanes rishiriensis TaxID=1050105 RepID=A0A919MUL8_9ACTN|nr:hypothetical protein [Actinoplanes rishiriensis]GIF00477.1 hypothetical protein Ari01nite_79410 [Actinoplanes rishiriensis]
MTTASIRFAAVLSAAVLAAGCAAGTDATGAGKTTAHGNPVIYAGDYPVYGTAKDLYRTANLVVEARLVESRVVKEAEPVNQGSDPKTNPQAGAPAGKDAPPAPPPLVETVFTAEVVGVHKGAAKAGDRVEVKQMGGTVDGVQYIEDKQTSMAVDKTYLLFLATFPDSPAALLSPEQGKYLVGADGSLTAMSGNSITLKRTDLTALAAAK